MRFVKNICYAFSDERGEAEGPKGVPVAVTRTGHQRPGARPALMSEFGTTRTCRGGPTTSAVGGITDMPFKRADFSL